AALKKLGVRDPSAAASVLLKEKGCTACHTGFGESRPRDVPIKADAKQCGGATYGEGIPAAFASCRAVAASERTLSPIGERQPRLERAGCVRCRQRDSDRPSAMEEIGSTLGGAFLQETPFLRAPRLTNPHQKFTRTHLASTVREGVSGLRGARYTYRMPAF